MFSEAENYRDQMSEAVMRSPAAQHFLTLGRVVVMKSQAVSFYDCLSYIH